MSPTPPRPTPPGPPPPSPTPPGPIPPTPTAGNPAPGGGPPIVRHLKPPESALDQVGGLLGDGVREVSSTVFEGIMRGIWDASLTILRVTFRLADEFSVFTVDTRTGPVSVLWPLMLWISGVLALGLFFWQLIVSSLRGGRGFLRLIVGPVQYGVALAVTVGLVGVFLAGVDGVSRGILQYGLRSQNFTDALQATSLSDATADGVKAVVLGLCALFGILPVAFGYVLEMLFREAAIYVLVATVPIVAGGLLANVTARWFWRTVRWLLASIAMKPVLAMTLVLGVAIAGGSKGLSGLLAGTGVLVISLISPFVIFRLFAFVDPNADAGAAFRDALSGVGVDSYGANNTALAAGRGALGGGESAGGGDGGAAAEDANTGRFDDAESAMDDGDHTGSHDTGGHDTGGDEDTGPQQAAAPDGGRDGDDAGAPLPANRAQVVASGGHPGREDTGDDSTGGGDAGSPGGQDPPGPEPPDGDGGQRPPDGPKSGGSGGSGGAAAEAEDAAVIV